MPDPTNDFMTEARHGTICREIEVNIHQRISLVRKAVEALKGRFLKTVVLSLLALLTGGGGSVWYASSVVGQVAANKEKVEAAATKTEIEVVRKAHQKDHKAIAKGVNWIGASVEKIADNAQVKLEPRPIIPEDP